MAEVTEAWAQPAERILYVLRLADGCYYVGQSLTDKVEHRLRKHFAGSGSAWTQLHPPIEVVERSVVSGSYREIELQENAKVIEYMRQYGVANVRGGFFSRCDFEETVKNLRHHGFDLE